MRDFMFTTPKRLSRTACFGIFCVKIGSGALAVASSFAVPCKNGSSETTVAVGGRNPVAGLWGRTLGEN